MSKRIESFVVNKGLITAYPFSELVRRTRYNTLTNTLWIWLDDGGPYPRCYAYYRVPPAVYLKFLIAESPGAFFNKKIKTVYYRRRLKSQDY